MSTIKWFDSEEQHEPRGMFGPKMGSWSVSSETDPRWNRSGRGYGLISCGGPEDIGEWLKECDRTLGERPDDLRVGFMKD